MGYFRKHGVELQRWGHFAKVGAKRKGWGKIAKGVETQMAFFDKDKLMKVAYDRGYYNLRAVGDGLAPVFETTSKRMQNKLERGKLTKEECEVIGSFFEMTMKEYYDVFMNGLFKIDSLGRYICHIDNMKEHMNPPEPEEEKPQKRKRMTKLQQVEALLEEIQRM